MNATVVLLCIVGGVGIAATSGWLATQLERHRRLRHEIRKGWRGLRTLIKRLRRVTWKLARFGLLVLLVLAAAVVIVRGRG